ncbi:MAG: type II secretion system F family protein [Bryobacteraceae bacterium]|jgi:tight adherence protein B
MSIGLFLVIFLVLLVVIAGGAWFAWEVLTSGRKKELLGQLSGGRTAEEVEDYEPRGVFITREELDRRAQRNPLSDLTNALERKIAMAGLEWSGGGLLLGAIVAGAAGALIGWIFPVLVFRWLTAAVLALVFGWFPFFYVGYLAKKRMREFEEQFPEALDFIARSLRAGHAFSASLEMLANEAPEPLSSEFRRVFQQQNLGSPMETVLEGLAQRVPLVDVKFFVSAVLLQREAGGNLSEILEKLAHTVRERFRLKGHVLAATGAARVTAMILTAIPLFVFVSLQLNSPEYIEVLRKDPLGPWLLAGAVGGQILGYYLMNRLINFKF